MPPVAFLEVVPDKGPTRSYSILHNSSFSNNAQLFKEAERRIPTEDYLTIANGFIGSYPNVFFQVPDQELENFLLDIESLRTEINYADLVSRYGVRRTANRFWELSDKFYDSYKTHHPRESRSL